MKKIPGLVVASRSMNVSREKLQQWNLQAAIYSTKSLRICAASAPLVVVLAHGIFDSNKAREVPGTREISRPREETAGEAIRRMDALCPWLVGAERREIRPGRIYLQRNSPGREKESNWLLAAQGGFNVTMRIYWPKESVLDGSWKPAAIQMVP
jgi:hypothetical protein